MKYIEQHLVVTKYNNTLNLWSKNYAQNIIQTIESVSIPHLTFLFTPPYVWEVCACELVVLAWQYMLQGWLADK